MSHLKLAAVVTLALLSLGITGCGASFARTAEERSHMYSSNTRSELRMLKDDVDRFLMMDERSRLTRWH